MPRIFSRISAALKAFSGPIPHPGGYIPPGQVPGRYGSSGYGSSGVMFVPMDGAGGTVNVGRDGAIGRRCPSWENAAVAIGLSWITDNFSQADLAVETQDGSSWVAVDDHAMIALLSDPSPEFGVYDFFNLWDGALLSAECDGNGYWLKARDRTDAVRELWWVPHTCMEPYRVNPLSPEYRYRYTVTVPGLPNPLVRDFEPRDVVHFRNGPPDPCNDLKACSALKRCFREVASDTEVSEYTTAILANRGMPGMLAIFDDDAVLNEDVAAEIKAGLKRSFTGENRGETAVLRGPVKFEFPAFSPDKLALTEISRIPEARICAALGVPPMILGLSVGDTQKSYCLPADARVWTPAGPKQIVDVCKGDIVWSFVDGTIKPRAVLKSGKTGHKTLYEVRTKNRTLRASGNHPVLVRVPGRNGGGSNASRSASYAWKRVDELTLTDRIVQPKSLPDLGGTTLPDGRLATPEYLNFLGAIVGDGVVVSCKATQAVHMCIPRDDRTAQPYRELAATVFDGYRHGNTPIVITELKRRFQFASNRATKELIGFEFGGRAKTKRIPGWIFGLNRSLRLAFIAGLVDTDGSIDKRGALTFAFCNRDLVLDVRDLLISVGIQVSNLTYSRLSPDVLPQRGTKDYYENWRIVASSAVQVAEIPFHDPLYRERVELNSERYRGSGYDSAKAGLSSDLGFFGISSIRVLPSEDVYDIEVEEGHSFIADGMVVHNSNQAQAERQAWRRLASLQGRMAEALYRQLLPDFEEDRTPLRVVWDYSRVDALQEDRDALSKRTISEYQAGLVYRDEGRAILGRDPVDGGRQVFWEGKNPNEAATMAAGSVDGSSAASGSSGGKPGKPKGITHDVVGTGHLSSDPLPGGDGQAGILVVSGSSSARADRLRGSQLPVVGHPEKTDAETLDALAYRVLKQFDSEATHAADARDARGSDCRPQIVDSSGRPLRAKGQPTWSAEWEADRETDDDDVSPDGDGDAGVAGGVEPGSDDAAPDGAEPGSVHEAAGEGPGEANAAVPRGGGSEDPGGVGDRDGLDAEPAGE